MIEFQNLSVKKGENQVLKNISLSIPEKSNLGIVGENGSGKSTVLDVIAGRIFPWKGKIVKPHYSEIELVPRDYGFQKIVGTAYQYYQQRYHAYDSELGPTVIEVIQNQVLPVGTVDPKSVDLPPKRYPEEFVDSISEQMNIKHLLQRKVATLSNGETRRTIIAISLLKKPKVLLLDNPFVGLDVESNLSLKKLLGGLDVQLILVSDSSEMPDNVERIIELQEGEIKQVFERPFPECGSKRLMVDFNKELLEFFKSKNSEEYQTAVRFVNGNVSYNGKKVLFNINWEVSRGEKWALTGPNGSGESTLLSLLIADNPQAYSNEIYLFDKRRGSGESIWDIKKRVGYLSPEMHIYFPKETAVWKVIASGLFDTIGLFRKIGKEHVEVVDKIIDMLNLGNLRDRTLKELSTGEQRLVLLARALVKNPDILILDEPCQNLDYNHMVFFRDLINQLAMKLNKTLVFVSHNPEEIPACVNRNIRLENGKMM